MLTSLRFASITLFTVCIVSTSVRADDVPFARVAPLFQTHCNKCHGIEKPKGKLRIDKLDPDLVKGKDLDHWTEVLNRLNFGDMPPATEPALKKEDRDLMTAWLNQEHRKAALAKKQTTHFRRLTRLEYERTMQDLLGLQIEFGSRLPEDGKSKDGFRNDGDALRMSPLQYETYLQIADDALAEAIVSGPAPVVHRYRLSVNEKQPEKAEIKVLEKPGNLPGESFANDNKKNKGYPIRSMSGPKKGWDNQYAPSAIRRFGEAAVQMPERVFAFGIHNAFRKGETRIKVRVARVEPTADADKSRMPYLTLAIGSTNFHGVELKTIGEPTVIDHTEFRTYEFRVRMENFSAPNSGPLNDKNSTVLAAWNSAKTITNEKQPPKLKFEWIEFESPFHDTWPPKTHTDILFQQDYLKEPAYAREVIRRFATRAYRGPVAPAELDRLVKFWTIARAGTDTLEESLRDTLGVVLTSPRFLGLPASRKGPVTEKLNDHELAARLSYFLWSTMPDDALVRLADEKKLRDGKVLGTQVRRMIQDPRAWLFVEQYADQWLELDRLQRVTISKSTYPGVDESMIAAMRQETIHYFGEVLQRDQSVFNFLDSDFTCVNDALATHYGIKGVIGPKFRKVKLDPELHRGGLLTHASILTGLSDGKDGHPIKRGMWLLKNLFDETPPPPPPNVPELNRESPKVRNLTIPQALVVHRDNPACNGCHRKIDPYGIAFEEYDAVGNWQRDGEGAKLRKRRTSHPIDAKTELPTGVKIDGLRELKNELIRTKSDDFRRAMLRKMMAYALGRSLTLSDIHAADAMVPALRERGDRLPALIELIAVSEPFQSK